MACTALSSFINPGRNFWFSNVPPVRRWNIRDVSRYIDNLAEGELPVGGEEQLDRQQQIVECNYLGFRQTDGLIIERFNQAFECDFLQRSSEALKPLEEDGMLIVDGTSCRLTEKGMQLLDSVVERFLILVF